MVLFFVNMAITGFKVFRRFLVYWFMLFGFFVWA